MRADKQTAKIGSRLAGPGRRKGVPNKTTALLKDAVLKAAQEAGGGGEDGLAEYLKTQATQNPVAFMGLLGKVLPMQVTGQGGGPVRAAVTVVERRIVRP